MKKIILSGTWIVDHVKFIKHYPKPGYLVYILKEKKGLGGGPYNVGINLRILDPSLPLFAIGKIGNDEGGREVISALKKKNINTDWVKINPKLLTSYTDVITEIESGRRTFFHHQGANTSLGIEDFPLKDLKDSILYLGYIMALPALDKEDSTYGTISARLFKYLKENNVKIALDFVSLEGEFKKKGIPPLKFVDYLIINELEAEKLTDIKIKSDENIDLKAAEEALKKLKTYGDMEYIIIHFSEGSIAHTKENKIIIQPSLDIPQKDIINTLGAGDAFFAGILYGIYKNWDVEKSIRLGTLLAGACLFWETTTGKINIEEIYGLEEKYGFRKLDV